MATIFYSERFKKQHKNIPYEMKKKAMRTIDLFLQNPLHPSLRLHKLSGALQGYWSLSIDRKYRIIVEPLQDNSYLLISIGTHAIYDHR